MSAGWSAVSAFKERLTPHADRVVDALAGLDHERLDGRGVRAIILAVGSDDHDHGSSWWQSVFSFAFPSGFAHGNESLGSLGVTLHVVELERLTSREAFLDRATEDADGHVLAVALGEPHVFFSWCGRSAKDDLAGQTAVSVGIGLNDLSKRSECRWGDWYDGNIAAEGWKARQE